jgi:hypothetical protein
MTAEVPTTGPEAILAALQAMDLDALEKEQREIIRSGRRTKRDRAVRMLNAIEGLRRNQMKPDSLMLRSVPVIPPKFRPFSITGSTFLPGDSNEVYRDLMEYRRLYSDTEKLLGKSGASEAYMDLVAAAKAAYGYGDSPNPKTKARAVKGFFKMVTGTNPKHCYDEKTEILTRRGWILFKDLRAGDQVGTIDPDTNGFLWSYFENYVDAPYNGLMVKFDRRRQNLLVTPNHRMWVKKRRRNENVTSEADMLRNWEIVDAARLVYASNRTWTQTAAAAYEGGEMTEIPGISAADLSALAGWYASEGNAHGGGVVIWQSDRNMAYCEELEALFGRLQATGRPTGKWSKEQGNPEDPSTCWGWSLAQGDLSQWLIENVGACSHEKKLSPAIREWPKENLEQMLCAYLKGDGAKRQHGVEVPRRHYTHKFRNPISDEHQRMSTVSKQLFDDLQEVAFKLGVTLLRVSEDSSQAGRYGTNTREIYCGGLIGRWNFTADNQTPGEWEEYDGRIYCVQVPTGLLVVRREGKVCVSGNSFYQQKMLSKPVDTVGRGVIIPDADLGMDEVGVPEDMAWRLYGNYVQRRLVRSGMSPAAALKHIAERTPVARKALDSELPNRPGVLTRSPAWHRTNVIGQNIRLVPGDAIRVNTFITEGQNADFNGDLQVGKILVLAVKDSEFENRISDLRCCVDGDMLRAMKLTNMTPLFNETTGTLHLCDMEDLPRGPLIATNENGKNGVIHFYRALPGMQAISFDEASGATRWAPVFGISVHPDREIEVVQLSNGRQIITDDDPRAVYGLDLDTLEMLRTTPSQAQERRIAVPCTRDISVACAGLGSLNTTAVGDQLVNLDFDFGYLLGALCGDGWWDKRDYQTGGRNVYLSDLKGFVAAKIGSTLRALFGPVSYSAKEFKAAELEGRYGDTVKHTFSGKGGNLDAFVQFCSQWMGGHSDEDTAGSGNKKLPDMFLLAPLDFRRGLLTGLFDTDGSCSVSQSKGPAQLLCQITTTSVRLAADIKFLCLTMGVHASVGFSKTTKRGNTSWVCNVSTAGLRERDNLLRDLQTPEKRSNFLNTPVSGENTSLVHNKAAVPRAVFDLVHADLVNPKISKEDRAKADPDTEWRKHQQNMVVQWAKGKSEGTISRPSARAVLAHLGELLTKRTVARDAALTLLRSGRVEMTKANVEVLRAGVYATAAPYSADRDKDAETFKLASIVKAAAYAGGVLGDRRHQSLLSRLEALPVYRGALDSDLLKVWIRDILDQENITWATVTEVQKTGIRETGYDLTVPGYETFMSADGVILSNTMSIHIPSTDEAVKDVREKMMASKMLWSIKDRSKTMGNPKHEMIVGLNMPAKPGGARHRFASEQEAMEAIENGRIDLNDEIEIK